MNKAALCAAVALVTGCASFDGRGLVPGKSSAAEVEALMGDSTERLSLPNGDTALYFSRQPAGRALFVVTLGPDGVLKSIEQLLIRRNFDRIAIGVSTQQDVRAILGPPGRSGRFARLTRDWWEYKFLDLGEKRVLWVQFSDDGVVREVLDMLDPEEVKPSPVAHRH